MTSRPSLLAAAWASPISNTGAGVPTLPMIANRRRLGTTYRSSSRRLALVSGAWIARPVTLPPGRARLGTRPVATGSPAPTNTIGMVEGACFAAIAVGGVGATMRSTLSRTNSAAISAKGSARPSPQRYSMATVRFSIQPSSRSRCTKAATRWLSTKGVAEPKNPTVGKPGQQWIVPVGGGLGRLFKVGDQPISASVQGFYNVVRPDNGPTWTLRLFVSLLFPDR